LSLTFRELEESEKSLKSLKSPRRFLKSRYAKNGPATPETRHNRKQKHMNENSNGSKIEPLVYTVKETSVVLNCSTKTVRRLLARRQLAGCKALRKILIPREQVHAFLKATCDKPVGWTLTPPGSRLHVLSEREG